MRVLITGGAGFVGSHLADALLARGESIVIYDDFSTGRESNIAHLVERPDVTVVRGDIRDELHVNRVMGGVDACFHLAAAVGVNLIVEEPLRSLTTNIRGSEVVLGAAEYFKVKTLVTSTSEIYGKNTSDVLREGDDRILGSPLKVRWTYSEAKAIEEALAYTLWEQSGLPTIIARLFNTVGPRQTGHYGMVVPRFVASALAGDPVTVYGTGDQSRVFCHVQDAVAGLLSLWDDERTPGDVFNVGGVGEISMNQLAERVIANTGSTSEIVHIPYEQAYEPGFEDMQRRVPSTEKIKGMTGWQPKRTLDDIIRDVAEYQRSTGTR
ncbi:MAG: GDP-mannose 4,6-dehydratase [Candidatus Nanopelagicales bacterium]